MEITMFGFIATIIGVVLLITLHDDDWTTHP